MQRKRDKCRERVKEFRALDKDRLKRNLDWGGHPFGHCQGFIVTHVCTQDDTLVHDFIVWNDHGADFSGDESEVWPALPLPTPL